MASDPSRVAEVPSTTRVFIRVALPLFVLYLLTASWSLPLSIDTATNVFTAAELGSDGDVLLDHHEALADPAYRGTIAWIVPAGDSVAAQYPPGAPLLAAPLYAIWPEDARVITAVNEGVAVEPIEVLMPPLGPAAITSALVAAVTIGLLALAFARLTDQRTALVGAYVVGLGTGVWSVAADALWQHGPAMLWIVAGTILSIRRRFWSGLAFGAAILTRPHTAVVAAGNGLYQSWHDRSAKPVIGIGIGSMVGLAALIAFNAAVFGSPSISGGYSDSFASSAASLDIVGFARNILLALVHPVRGLLIYSPFLVVLVPGIPTAWRKAPGWVRGSALGGVVYLLLQLKANRYSGGDTFWGYRYPLEMLAAAAPLLLLSYTEWVHKQSAMLRRVFLYTVAVSVLLTAIGSVYY